MQQSTLSVEPIAIVTVTSKGQITLPAQVRKLLNTQNNRKLEVSVQADGSLKLKPTKYPTLESLAGAAGSLPDHLKSMSLEEIRQIALEDLAEQMIAKGK